MAVGASDLVLVGCANHAEDDASAQGGAISKGKLLFFSTGDISAVDEIEVLADDAISATITITGRSAVGAQITEAVVFAGETGPKTTTLAFERVEKVRVTGGALPADATVTLMKEAGDVEILKLYGSSVSPSGTAVTQVRKMFLGAAIPVSGSNTYYEKAYWLNAHDVDALTSPRVKEFADPVGVFSFALETAADGSTSIANRLTAPTGLSFDSADKDFSPGTLAAGSAIPVWVKLVLSSALSPAKSYVTLRCEGETL